MVEAVLFARAITGRSWSAQVMFGCRAPRRCPRSRARLARTDGGAEALRSSQISVAAQGSRWCRPRVGCVDSTGVWAASSVVEDTVSLPYSAASDVLTAERSRTGSSRCGPAAWSCQPTARPTLTGLSRRTLGFRTSTSADCRIAVGDAPADEDGRWIGPLHSDPRA